MQRYLDSGELVAPLARAVPLGLQIAAWAPPAAKGNRSVSAVEEGLAQLAKC